jgi:hypothetical protein
MVAERAWADIGQLYDYRGGLGPPAKPELSISFT